MSGLEIVDLPEELLECILRHVKSIGTPETFWNCLRTCKTLHRIGLGLYSGLGFAAPIIIESDTRCNNVQQQDIGSSFHMSFHVEICPPSQLYLSLVKSLTVHVQHRRIAVPSVPAGTDLVTSLMDIFPLTRRLTTFSLRFSDGWDFPSTDVPAVPQSLLAQLVDALPETVIHLELDTAGMDVPPSIEFAENNPAMHLCCQVSRILTRLRRLRLRVGHVCDTLLGFESSSLRCSNYSNCEYCISDECATCTLLRTWKMSAMTIWLPQGQNEETERFVQASTALLSPSLRNPAVVLLVHQRDLEYVEHRPRRRSYIQFDNAALISRQKFSWTPQSNVAKALSERLPYFAFTTITGTSKVGKETCARYQELLQSCPEHEILRRKAVQTFHISPSLGLTPEPGSTSPYPYMAEQTVENMLSWTQNTHLGYRFPLALSDEPNEPFWKSEKIWACRFPECRERCETIVHLRGHHMYTHPSFQKQHIPNEYYQCPSTGCEKVGGNGFTDRDELEQHLLEHHRGPCTGADYLREIFASASVERCGKQC